jgi:tetratricopeptide (TPR) repeat protein
MDNPEIQDSSDKSAAFFERAEDVVVTNNFDYAIDMYLEGLKRAPDELEKGHLALRRLAYTREEQGEKKPSMTEKLKYRPGKTPLEDMLSASFLLAKDPDNISYLEMLLKACIAGRYPKTGTWAAYTLHNVNTQKEKPSYAAYMLLKDAFTTFELYEEAIKTCKLAYQLKPENEFLNDEMKNLCAKMTVKNGKYGTAEDFRGSIKDAEGQHRLIEQDSMVKSAKTRENAVENAKKTLQKNPDLNTNISNLAKAYYNLDTDEGFRDATDLLKKSYEQKGAFAFKRLSGEMHVKKLRAMLRLAKTTLDADPENKQIKLSFDEILAKLSKLELEHYRLCVENYPTDLGLRYEYALRLLVNQQYDEALPLFQEARNDPSRKLAAMDKTGMCFFHKQWYTDAIDIFKDALKECDVVDSKIGKDIRYNLARSYEENDQAEKALDVYRKLAQLDFNYKDVAQRVNKLRT